jgi:DNA-binding HxlR family transcriptional regulator
MVTQQTKHEPSVYLLQCPSRELLVRVADKWTALLIVALSKNSYRFGELRRHIEGISQKMLTQTLVNMERDGLVMRKVFTGKPLRVEYSLTPLGTELIHVLNPLLAWAEDHLGDVINHRSRYDLNNAA